METNRDNSLEERMNRLEDKLAGATTGTDEIDKSNAETRKGYSQAMKISSEFISAIVVGAMIGYLLDLLLSSKPWGMIVFLLLGFVAGILNVLRVVGKVKSPHPVDRLGMEREPDNKR